MEEITIIDTVGSTNSALSELVASGDLQSGFMLMARCQVNGRGQRGNSWESAPFLNLTASMLLRPRQTEPSDQFYLTMVVSLGVIDTLTQLLPDANWAIKWPNDIYCDDRKIAGILIENVLMGNHFGYCIAGIGLNINQTIFTSNAPNPVSLRTIAGREFTIDQVAADLRRAVVHRFDQLESGGGSGLRVDYLEKLFRRGIASTFIHNDQTIRAVVIGVDEYGRLMLTNLADGVVVVAAFKEIAYQI